MNECSSTPLVNLIADEVLPSVEFYTRHLGFTETFRTPRDDIPVHVELVLGTLKIAISARSAARTDHGLDLQPDPPRVDLGFWCEDADAAYTALLEAGVPGLASPHDSGPNRIGFLTDPAGHLVSVCLSGHTDQRIGRWAPSSQLDEGGLAG